MRETLPQTFKLTFGTLILAAAFNAGCEREPQSAQHDQPSNERMAGERGAAPGAGPGESAPGVAAGPTTGDARSEDSLNSIRPQDDPNLNPATGAEVAEHNKAIEQQEPGSGQAANRHPASTGGKNPALPRDTKGVPGSRFGSNIESGQAPNVPGTAGQAAPLPQAAAPQMGATIDVSKYPYSKKSEFRNEMRSRLNNVDQAIKGLKASAAGAQQSAEGPRQKRIETLEKQESQISNRLGGIDKVPKANWEQFKTSFRDDVMKLERSYQDLSTASR